MSSPEDIVTESRHARGMRFDLLFRNKVSYCARWKPSDHAGIPCDLAQGQERLVRRKRARS